MKHHARDSIHSIALLFGGFAGTLSISQSAWAVGPSYLPLKPGARWTLTSTATKTPMVYEVTGVSGSVFDVRWDNPWVKNVVFSFRPSGPQIMLAALDMGTGQMRLPDGVVYFDFDPAGPKQWSNVVGQFSIEARGLKVETPSGVYEDCIHVRYVSKEKHPTDYYFAPGVGYVQVGEGRSAFRLRSFERGGTSSAPSPRPGAAPTGVPPATPALTGTGTPLIGLEVNVPGDINQSSYLSWYDKAYKAGARHIQASPIWSDSEKRASSYDYSAVDVVFQVAKQYSQPVYLNFRVIDTNNLAVPGYLGQRALDDPVVISGFKNWARAVAARTTTPSLVKWVSLGNEVDVYLLDHRASIAAYSNFVRAVAVQVRQLFPSAGITVNFTYGGLGELRGALLPVSQQCDFYSFSYYPLNADFSFRDPSTAASEFNKMIDAAQGRKVFFQEIGYASGARLNSSEQKQALFMEQAFKVLQERKDGILGASFVWMSDLDDRSVQQLTTYYRLPNQDNFREYLATLGLFDRQGRAKSACAVFEREAPKLAPPR